MDKVRYGIIGCGMMGQEHLRNIALFDEAEIAAIYEPDTHMAALSQALAPKAQFEPSLEALLARQDISAWLVASPNHCHADQLAQIAARNPKPLLMEKPFFTDPSDHDRVGQLARSYPAPIWVAMEYRYMPPIAAFLERATAATGGIQMLTIREHRFPFLEKVGDWNRFNRNTGGTFVEKCCHFFDLMRLTLQDEPVRVMASAGQAVNHLDERYAGAQPDILDHGYVIVEFAKGARAMLELCMFAEGAEFQEEISAVGPTGKIEAFVPGPGRFWPSELGAPPVAQLVESPREPKGAQRHEVRVPETVLEAGDHNGATFFQHAQFLSLVQRKSDDIAVGYRDGIASVMMGLAAQKSAETGQAVQLDPTQWAS